VSSNHPGRLGLSTAASCPPAIAGTRACRAVAGRELAGGAAGGATLLRRAVTGHDALSGHRVERYLHFRAALGCRADCVAHRRRQREKTCASGACERRVATKSLAARRNSDSGVGTVGSYPCPIAKSLPPIMRDHVGNEPREVRRRFSRRPGSHADNVASCRESGRKMSARALARVHGAVQVRVEDLPESSADRLVERSARPRAQSGPGQSGPRPTPRCRSPLPPSHRSSRCRRVACTVRPKRAPRREVVARTGRCSRSVSPIACRARTNVRARRRDRSRARSRAGPRARSTSFGSSVPVDDDVPFARPTCIQPATRSSRRAFTPMPEKRAMIPASLASRTSGPRDSRVSKRPTKRTAGGPGSRGVTPPSLPRSAAAELAAPASLPFASAGSGRDASRSRSTFGGEASGAAGESGLRAMRRRARTRIRSRAAEPAQGLRETPLEAPNAPPAPIIGDDGDDATRCRSRRGRSQCHRGRHRRDAPRATEHPARLAEALAALPHLRRCRRRRGPHRGSASSSTPGIGGQGSSIGPRRRRIAARRRPHPSPC